MTDANDHTAGESRISHVGSFRFLFDTQEWEWSDEVAEMHGYRPGEVTPTTELIAGHKHPDDRQSFEELLATMLDRRIPFSSRHRIVDTKGEVRHVAVVSQQLTDESGAVIGAGCLVAGGAVVLEGAQIPDGSLVAGVPARRIGWVGAEIAAHGGAVVACPIAPYDATRKAVRQMVEHAGARMVLVHVATALAECERRDRKGLYAKARAGELPDFTGISAPYEAPEDADEWDADPRELGEFLAQFVALALTAGDEGKHVYCWLWP